MMPETFDAIILGAGAAGLMCAAESGRRGRRSVVLEKSDRPGKKILISGGGRCNFTNLYTTPDRYLSANPHFAKSALSRYSPHDFLDLVEAHGIAWHEKTLGQLFCDGSARQIVDLLLDEVARTGGQVVCDQASTTITHDNGRFRVTTQDRIFEADALVIATGGPSIPKMGATGFAYDVANQFDIPMTDTRAALVPLTFSDARFKPLAGTALAARISNASATFEEGMLFTHRGLSGPSILQISSYWREGEVIFVNLIPDIPLYDLLRTQRQAQGRRNLTSELAQHLPARLVEYLTAQLALTGNLADQSDARLTEICTALQAWPLTPNGSEGYRTAEVTLGGIDTDALSSKTMMSKTVPDLYFIGEAVDVTGWLGGYNFQWAWSSGWAAAQALNSRA